MGGYGAIVFGILGSQCVCSLKSRQISIAQTYACSITQTYASHLQPLCVGSRGSTYVRRSYSSYASGASVDIVLSEGGHAEPPTRPQPGSLASVATSYQLAQVNHAAFFLSGPAANSKPSATTQPPLSSAKSSPSATGCHSTVAPTYMDVVFLP